MTLTIYRQEGDLHFDLKNNLSANDLAKGLEKGIIFELENGGMVSFPKEALQSNIIEIK